MTLRRLLLNALPRESDRRGLRERAYLIRGSQIFENEIEICTFYLSFHFFFLRKIEAFIIEISRKTKFVNFYEPVNIHAKHL